MNTLFELLLIAMLAVYLYQFAKLTIWDIRFRKARQICQPGSDLLTIAIQVIATHLAVFPQQVDATFAGDQFVFSVGDIHGTYNLNYGIQCFKLSDPAID